jgi:hypothetical protein
MESTNVLAGYGYVTDMLVTTNADVYTDVSHSLGNWTLPVCVGYVWLTDSYSVGCRRKPSAWVRFWQRLLLGWRWESIPADGEGATVSPSDYTG